MGTKERKRREKEQRRESIIDAAEKVFFSKGFAAATMDDIALESELSKGTLYLYFNSKEDLHLAVAKRAIGILNQMTGIVKDVKKNAIQKLQELGRIFIKFAEKHPGYLNSILRIESVDFNDISLSRDELKSFIFRESPVNMAIELVKQGVKEKTIRQDIPTGVIANILWTQMLGMFQFVTFHNSLFELTGMSEEQLFDNYLELLLNGIRS